MRAPFNIEGRSSAGGHGQRVLVVEDERDIRELLVELLSDEGYVVSFACDGQDALRQVLLRWPDLILLDLMMPVMSGWQFLDVLSQHQLLDRIRVIVISAFNCDTEVAAVIPKPFEVEEVLESVHRLAS
jgi:CheY-like chemotaxis protein